VALRANKKAWIRAFFWMLPGLLLFLYPAFFNGYPLVYSDTGTYIRAGFSDFFPEDRPIFYSWFLRVVSGAESFWLPVGLQGLIFTLIFADFFKTWSPAAKSSPIVHVLITLFTVTFTGIAWYVAQLTPDWAMAVLALQSLVVIHPSSSLKKILVHSFLAIPLCLMHFSHPPILLVWWAGVWLWKRKRFKWTSVLFPAGAVVAMLINMGISSTHGFGFHYTPFGATQHVARLAQVGLLQAFLKDQCAPSQGYAPYKLCHHQGQIPPSILSFLYDPNSPLYLEGGAFAVRQEYEEVSKRIWTEWPYAGRNLVEIGVSTLSQLLRVAPGEALQPYGPGSPPYGEIADKMPHELPLYLNAKQQLGQGIDFSGLRERQWWALWICLVGWGFLWWKGARFPRLKPMIELTFLVALAMFANALITGGLHMAYERFQTRVTWLMLPTSILCVMAAWPELKAMWVQKEQNKEE
jgi:hypothetical protein